MMKQSKPQHPPRRLPAAWLLVAGIGVLLLAAMSIGVVSLHGQEDEATAASRLYQIKAAYLYQLGRYIQWPAKAFSSAEAPFVIGVPKQDPIAADLDQIAQTKKIDDRPIQIRRFSPDGEVPACHILYLPSSLAPDVQAAIIHKVSGKNVLLVGDSDKIHELGGAVRFVLEENNVRLHIVRKAAQREGLTISSKLLQVARVLD